MHVVLQHTDGRLQTVSYPKYLMEVHLGYLLEKDETVHHKDDDFTNNDMNNLEILKRGPHARQDHIKIRSKSEKVKCVWCGGRFKISWYQIQKGRDKFAGPFCSKHCVGEYGAAIQNGNQDIIKRRIDRIYYK